MVELGHGGNSSVVTVVDLEENTLDGQVCVLGGVLGSDAAVSSQAEELGEDQEAILQGLLLISVGLDLQLGQGIGLLLLVLVGQLLLGVGLGRGKGVAPLFVELEDLGELLLGAGEFGLEGGFVLDLSLLVGVDDLSSKELLGGLVTVLADDGLGLGGVQLGGRVLV